MILKGSMRFVIDTSIFCEKKASLSKGDSGLDVSKLQVISKKRPREEENIASLNTTNKTSDTVETTHPTNDEFRLKTVPLKFSSGYPHKSSLRDTGIIL